MLVKRIRVNEGFNTTEMAFVLAFERNRNVDGEKLPPGEEVVSESKEVPKAWCAWDNSDEASVAASWLVKKTL